MWTLVDRASSSSSLVDLAFTRGLDLPLPHRAMDALSALLEGFRVALTPINLLWALAGVTLGTLVGVLPGIGPALTVALLLPVTFSLQPIEAFIMFAGIYYGGMYGGSTTAILLNTPGESASVMTAVEGHLMARAGRGGAALATAAIGSFVAGTLATAALTFSAPVMANAALRFGPAEYFALTLLAFVAVSSVLGESTLKGLASLFFGLAARPHRHRPADRRGATELRDSAASRRHRRRHRRGRAVRGRRVAVRRVEGRNGGRGPDPAPWIDLDDAGGLVAFVAAVAARDRARVSGRCAACRRIGDPDVPLVRARAPARARAAAVWQRSDRRRGRSRSGEQRRRRRHAGAAPHARPADLGHRGAFSSPRFSNTDCSRVRCCSRGTRSSCGD